MDKKNRKIIVKVKSSRDRPADSRPDDDLFGSSGENAGDMEDSVIESPTDEVLQQSASEPESEPGDDIDDGFDFLSPDDMIKKTTADLVARVSFDISPAPSVSVLQDAIKEIQAEYSDSDEEDEGEFLTPEEMLAKTAGEKLSDAGAASKTEEDSFLSPDDMILRVAGDMLQKEDTPKTSSPADMGAMMTPEDMDSTDEGFESEPVAELVSMEDLESTSMMAGHKMAPSEMSESEEMNSDYIQLEMAPITKKGDVLSPDEMLSPDEFTQQEEFVSKALLKGTRIHDRFQVLRIIREQRDRNTYLVKDFRDTGKKFILKEVIPPPMTKAEYRDRRNIFNDTIRILNTFNHSNLVKVYEGFSENNRDYYYIEQVDGLDLVRITEMNTKYFTEKEVIKWGLQLCQAAEFLHYRPVPFTLGEIEPRHIMVDDSGNVKIIGYDLQRFFDVNRTLAYLPDNPTTLYEDVGKIARILFFLLTKNEFDDNSFEIEWPDHVGEKMRKLMETACKKGQRTYGDIKVFARKLEDTQIEDKPETLRKRWGFDFTRLNFSWVKNGILAVINQKPYMIAVEILFLLFLLMFSFFNNLSQAGYRMPRNTPLAFITTKDTLFTVNLDNLEIVDQRPLGYMGGTSVIINSKVPRKDDKSKKDDKTLLLVADEAGRQLFAYDIQDNSLISQISTGNQPYIVQKDPEKNRLWVLHRSNPMILTVDSENLKPLGIVPLEDDPSGIIRVPGDIKVFPQGKEPRYRRGKLIPFSGEKNQLMGYVMNSATGKTLTAVNPDTSEIIGNFRFEFVPGKIIYSVNTGQIFVLDIKNRRIVPLEVSRKILGAPIKLPEREKGPVAMMNEEGRGKIWVLFKETNQIAPMDPESGKFGESQYAGGVEPFRMVYRKSKNQIWILNAKTKNISILDVDKGTIVKDIKLGKVPAGVSFYEIKPGTR